MSLDFFPSFFITASQHIKNISQANASRYKRDTTASSVVSLESRDIETIIIALFTQQSAAHPTREKSAFKGERNVRHLAAY
jgi:hypothetical protein